ncbi:hypothetical protein [Cellulosilyticum sp. I15G10I2]|uniref:hypothetical protein n=1 Tax=Cellulosilyticum sp. I15G10I2 TaxID=1892843 RepID=UPI00085C8813|nr:hypothetical protein [Cellulosilyticum sp. I15G10I2]
MKKKWLNYIIFILVASCFIFVGSITLDNFNSYVQKLIARTMQVPGFWILYIDVALYVGFGILIGLDYLIREKRKTGKWKINISKFIIIGFPCLVFASVVPISIGLQITIGSFMVRGLNIYMPLFKILLGYTIVTSFYKESDTEGI